MTNYRMDGKVALVTGGSSGIGRAAALAFAERGASVVLSSRTEAAGQAVADAVRAAGGAASYVQADVTSPEQVAALVAQTVRLYGRLDYAFNNAGGGGEGGWVHDLSEAGWEETLRSYLTSVFLCLKYEIPAMQANGGGAIVNNASVDAERAFPMDPAYSAAKHGVLGLTKSAAIQYIGQGIRINAICPGWIDTPMTAGLFRDPEQAQRALAHQPIGRTGTPQEVAEAAVWLCSDAASLIVGTALAVDGGYLAV